MDEKKRGAKRSSQNHLKKKGDCGRWVFKPITREKEEKVVVKFGGPGGCAK